MKSEFFSALRLTLLCLVFFSGLYTLAVWAGARFLPFGGHCDRIDYQGGYGYVNVGQPFHSDRYFWPRPSAVGYDAAGSGGSNKGPSNPEYLAEVEARIDTFMVHNPGVDRGDIPAELVTASGSGLDPDISVKAARIQVARIARVRALPAGTLELLIRSHTEPPWLGIFGKERINVLKLNLALDKLSG